MDSPHRQARRSSLRHKATILLATLVLAACQGHGQPRIAPESVSPGPIETVCAHEGLLSLQILGSGGPIADDDRASSGYLLWHRNQARILVDVGGGVFQRFGAAGADLATLDLIALSHFHTDHSADLPALLKGAYFSRRSRPLLLTGPSGGGAFPDLNQFVQGLFDPERGIYRYLSGLLDGSDGLFALDSRTFDANPGSRHELTLDPALRVSALGVHHGIVPALAYRVDVVDEGVKRRIVFAGDQSAHNPAMVDFSTDADILVAHVAIPEQASPAARSLHRTPMDWARLAAAAGVQRLVLSHWMQRSLRVKAETLRIIRENYLGNVTDATDLACVVL